MVNISGPSVSDDFIGKTCEEAGITKKSLDGAKKGNFTLTEMNLAELELFRRKNDKTFADLLQWVQNLQGCGEEQVNLDKFRCMAEQAAAKKIKASKDSLPGITKELKETLFILPPLQTPNKVRSLANCKKCKHLNSANSLQKKQLMKTKKLLKKSRAECAKLHTENEQLKETSKSVNLKDFELQQKSVRVQKLQKQAKFTISHFKTRNVKRRLQTREKKITDLDAKKVKLESKFSKSATVKRNLGESKRYHVKQGKAEVQDTKLAKKFDSLQKRHDDMEEELDTTKRKLAQMEKEKMENKPTLKEGKQYNFKVRECYMGLASFGVSTSKMSNVTALVLNTIGGFDISEKDLPKQTFNKYMPREANFSRKAKWTKVP